MASSILTQGERERYTQIPVIEEADLRQFFYLTPGDMDFVGTFHGNDNRTAVALQVGIIRFSGYLPEGWAQQIGNDVLDFILQALKLPHGRPVSLDGYGSRQPTRSSHLQQVLRHLGFRRWQPMDEPFYEEWLTQRGMEHDNERWLLEKLCDRLYHDKILRPAIGTLERMVGAINESLHEETYRRLSFLWGEGLPEKLDALLELPSPQKETAHRWLCSPPTANTTREINQTLDKITFVRSFGTHGWDPSVLPANRKKRLANIARGNTNTYLQRTKPMRRYPLLVCFLWETLLDTTDVLVAMYRDYWQLRYGDAKKGLEGHRLEIARLQETAVRDMAKITELVIDDTIEDIDLRRAIFGYRSKQSLQESLQAVSKTARPGNQTTLFFLLPHYGQFKRFTPNFLATLSFDIAFSKDNFGVALLLVSHLQNGTRRKLPEDAPGNFITPSWERIMAANRQKAYELCVLSVLRDRLYSGDVFIRLSRKFADFNSFLLPKERWANEAPAICRQLGLENISGRIDGRVAQLSSLLGPLSQLLAQGVEIRLDGGELVVTPIKGKETTPGLQALREQINSRLPKVGIVEMIKEVDTWTGYSKEFGGAQPPGQNNDLLYAAFFGNACNLSLADLSRSSELDGDALWWTANNCFSDESLKRANDILVNHHHKQWLAGYWGGGTLSSSDGQRFPTAGKVLNAKALPRYFGYGKGVTFYTHTSDQYSQYGTKVIGATERDATYVLDEILSNETDLEILEHTTDTHGYSDLLFALFDLAGIFFAPRLRDIKDQRLCKIKGMDLDYPQLKFTGTLNAGYLKRHADELARVAASLQTGTVTASLLISKLQSYPRQNNLMYVLQGYGQLIKTIFVCKYLLELPLREKVNAQLNKGEQLHGLRVYLWFGGDGIIRKEQGREQQVTARCLNLLTNVVLVWNTVYIQQIIQQLRNEGITVGDEDLKRISPAPFEHINRFGKYDFSGDIRLGANGLRPLRKPKK